MSHAYQRSKREKKSAKASYMSDLFFLTLHYTSQRENFPQEFNVVYFITTTMDPGWLHMYLFVRTRDHMTM